jgi:hypothetical protein
LVLLATFVAVPIGIWQRCRFFEQGFRAPRIRPKPPSRALTPLEAAARDGYVALKAADSSSAGSELTTQELGPRPYGNPRPRHGNEVWKQPVRASTDGRRMGDASFPEPH